jgi:hypothetical protein
MVVRVGARDHRYDRSSMSPEPTPARTRLDEVERGLDAIEQALARLDAGEVDEVNGAGTAVDADVTGEPGGGHPPEQESGSPGSEPA